MLKKPTQKNKRSVFLIGLTGLFIVACLAICIFSPSMNLVLNIFPSLSASAKPQSAFYGENIDMSQILPASQNYIVNNKGQDLIDIAANLGINLVRITNIQHSFNNGEDAIYTKEQWDQVLGKMQSKGIKAIILIETAGNNGDYYAQDIRPIYLNLVQRYIDSGVFSNPDVYAVDIKNEPVLTDANLRMLQAAHTMIKAKYPDLKQTIGAWATPEQSKDPYNPSYYNWLDFAAGKKIDTIVDFYCVHMYGLAINNFGVSLNPDLKTKVYLSQVEHGLQTTKPILIEEFGEANGDAVSDQDTIGSPQLQANVYQGVYQALKEMHNNQIIGSVAFDFYTRNQLPDAWAIVKNNGNYLFPAAYVLQEYASGKNNPSLQAKTVVTSQSYLVQNADNHAQKNLHISDRIGLKLQLDTSKNYTLSLSEKGIVQPVDLFHYYLVSDAYYAVYQAVNKGSVQITICSAGNSCTSPIYTLTITVQ